MEKWMPIDSYKGLYMVSDKGRVKSIDRTVHRNRGTTKMLHGRIIRQQKGTNGYLFVTLSKHGKVKSLDVHRLVAMAFVEGYNIGLVVNHKDENKHNNNASNLEWVTLKQNANYGTAIVRRVANSNFKGNNNPMYGKRGSDNPKSIPILQFNKSGILIAEWSSAAEASKMLKINASSIRRCINGYLQTSGGYIWKNKI